MFLASSEGPTGLESLLQEGGYQTKSLIAICPYDTNILFIAHVFTFVAIISQSLSTLFIGIDCMIFNEKQHCKSWKGFYP